MENNICGIPIIFGVTGHRDILEKDILKLEKIVEKIFNDFQKDYIHTEIIVISALAEGADMLVARVAKRLNLKLHILLPYEEELYLKTFVKENQEEFHTLKKYASRVETNRCDFALHGDECYELLGKRITKDVNILIALWDGVLNQKQGGTSEVIQYQRRESNNNRYDLIDGDALFIINTPRQQNKEIEKPFEITDEYMGISMDKKAFEKMLTNIDMLNQELVKNNTEEKCGLETHMKYFEKKSEKNQKKFKLFSKLTLAFTGIAIASLEIMHVLHLDNFILGYGIGLLLAFGIYSFFMRNGKVQNDFVFSRGFAEAIRIQNVWNSAKIDENVSSAYLKNQHRDFTWVKVALQGMTYADKTPFIPMYEQGNKPEDWIDGQLNYFQEAYTKRYESLEFFEKIEKVFYTLGFTALILMFFIYSLESLHIIHHGELWFSWHYLVLASGLLLLVATFIGEKYLKIEGYEEEIYHFGSMKKIFQRAKDELEELKKSTQEDKQKRYNMIIIDLGLKALEENSKWVILHSSTEVKPSLD